MYVVHSYPTLSPDLALWLCFFILCTGTRTNIKKLPLCWMMHWQYVRRHLAWTTLQYVPVFFPLYCYWIMLYNVNRSFILKYICVNVYRSRLLWIIWLYCMAKEGNIKKQSLCAREHWRSGRRYGVRVMTELWQNSKPFAIHKTKNL